jgi:hypothetical protein
VVGRVVRYIALAVAVPTTALLYGYHGFGHLPLALEATAIPLAHALDGTGGGC